MIGFESKNIWFSHFYQGHEEGVGISIKAAELGATVIERHFTLDKSQKVIFFSPNIKL